VAIGNGAWDPKIVLGDATVEEDGSAFFSLPARMPVYFQLLDEKGRLVQTMRSWTTIQPGENASCVGCHEHKNSTPVADLPLKTALRSGPQKLKPFYGEPRGFSFPQIIQPILDRHCVGCHNGEDDTPYDLTPRELVDSRAKRRWSKAYLALTHAHPKDTARNSDWRGNADHPMVNWVSAQSAPPMLPPFSAGSCRSKLIQLLDDGHEKVNLSPEELDKIAAWIDLGVPYCADYAEANTWTPAELEKHDRYYAKRRQLVAEDQANIAAWLRELSGETANR
jgi:hypothetical protein